MLKLNGGFSVLLAVLASVFAMFSTSANAQAVDLTALTTAVDFSSASAAVLVVAAALIVVYIAIKAAKFVINMVRSG